MAQWQKKIGREMGISLHPKLSHSHLKFMSKTGDWDERALDVMHGRYEPTVKGRHERIERMGQAVEGKAWLRERKGKEPEFWVYASTPEKQIHIESTIAHELGHIAYLMKQGVRGKNVATGLKADIPTGIISEIFAQHYELEYYRLNHPSLYSGRASERRTHNDPDHAIPNYYLNLIYLRFPRQRERMAFLQGLASAKFRTIEEADRFIRS